MAYSSRHRYKNRREKVKTINRNTRIILIFFAIACLVLIIKNRVWIYDWFRTLFY